MKIGNESISALYVGGIEVDKVYLSSEIVYQKTQPVVDAVTFEAKAASTIGLSKKSTNQTLQYSTDGTNWNTFDTSTSLSLNTGNKVYVRGTLSSNNTSSNYTQFTITGDVKASGNCNYIWNSANPAAALKEYCGARMFYDCTGLTDVSDLELPSTTLPTGAYIYMFRGCAFTTAPELPATTLSRYCYDYMFQYCTNLNYVKCLAHTNRVQANYVTSGWLQYVSSTGTFVCLEYSQWSSGNSGIPSGWTVQKVDEIPTGVVLKSTGSSTIGFSTIGTNQTLQYSRNNSTWSNVTTSTSISLTDGDAVLLRGTLSDANTTSDYTQLTITGNVKAYGNINYIWNYSNLTAALKDYCGYKLFYGCTGLTDISELELPATTLSFACYGYMFYGCTGITTAPALIATTLTANCYYYMFRGCTSLVNAPALPATTLYRGCYQYMFYNCTSLTTAPVLPATHLVGGDGIGSAGCYEYMFYGCSSLNYIECYGIDPQPYVQLMLKGTQYNWVNGVASNGTFVAHPAADWTTGTDGIPSGWTREDGDVEAIYFKANASSSINLTQIASLQTLQYSTDYSTWTDWSVNNSVSLNSGDILFVRGILTGDLQGYYDYTNFYCTGDLSVLGNINYVFNYLDPDAPLKTCCGSHLFSNSPGLTDVSKLKLPAMTLAHRCYDEMFRECANITAAPELPALTLATEAYAYMFYQCPNINYIKCLATDISAQSCVEGWAIDVASSGTFVKNANMSDWSTGYDGIPSGWTVQDA